MRDLGFRIDVKSPDVDETPLRGESPNALVLRLSREKALSVMERQLAKVGRREREACVIAADTIVVAPDGRRILGKPRDRAEAERILASLAGRTHTVFTGYAILEVRKGASVRRVSRAVRSRVTMRKLSREDIRRYVASGEPMDKAGAYAAQGLGMALIERISGSYTNVVGLPMAQLVADLEKMGFSLFDWKLKR